MRKLTIYIARHKHVTDKSGNSEPCAHCTKEIKRLGIKKIVSCTKFFITNSVYIIFSQKRKKYNYQLSYSPRSSTSIAYQQSVRLG